MKSFFVSFLFLSITSLVACSPSTDAKSEQDHIDMAVEISTQETQKSLEQAEEPVPISTANTPVPKEAKVVAVALKNPTQKEELQETKSAVAQKEETEAVKIVSLEEIKPSSSVAGSEETGETTVEQVKERTLEKKEVIKLIAKPDHSAWDALLRKYVSGNGKVNYAGLLADKSKLEAYLRELATHTIQADWSRNEKMAYWINVYNAFTIKLILDNYPLNSIIKLHNGKPWDVKWIKLGDKTYSLNQVENDILRPQYQDARIHFAVNCAAKSCPPLLNRAWTSANLEALLNQQAKSFINNPNFNKIKAKAVQVSKIFEWYAADFGDLIGFLNKYSETSIDKQATISYQEYDWALNE
jgi:hypothetical protein